MAINSCTTACGSHPSSKSLPDEKYGFRVDKGPQIDKDEIEVIIQANKGAQNPGVKKAAQKNSHDVVAKYVINIKKIDILKANSDLEASFKARK
jgi:hypothetical protein